MIQLTLPDSTDICLQKSSKAITKLSMDRLRPQILSQIEIKGVPQFIIERIDIPSSDPGISIPVTLLTPKTRPFNSIRSIFAQDSRKYYSGHHLNQKLIIKSYGCYGLNLDVNYSPSDLYLISQGYTIAYCHIRGGSERGNWWYETAKMEHKLKSV